MRTNPYEDQLVEQSTIELFAALGWQTVAMVDETVGPCTLLGRRTRGPLLTRLLAKQIDVEAAQ